MLQIWSSRYFKKHSFIGTWIFNGLDLVLANFPWTNHNSEILFLLFNQLMYIVTMFFYSFIADFKTSVSTLEKELRCLKMKRDEILNDMDEKRYWKTLN